MTRVRGVLVSQIAWPIDRNGRDAREVVIFKMLIGFPTNSEFPFYKSIFEDIFLFNGWEGGYDQTASGVPQAEFRRYPLIAQDLVHAPLLDGFRHHFHN